MINVNMITWQLETSHVIAIGTTVFVKTTLLLVWRQLKRSSNTGKGKTGSLQLGRWLSHFSAFCDVHYRQAIQQWQHYQLKKGNEFDGQYMIKNGQQQLQCVHPELLFKEYATLLSQKQETRVASNLMDLFCQLKWHTEYMHDLLNDFTGVYAGLRQEYYMHIAELIRLHDELREYVKGKTLDKQAGEWVQAFFGIFDQWIRNGAGREMLVLQQELVSKIVELNKTYTENPFNAKTNEMVFKCGWAFDKITQLDDTFRKHLWYYVCVYKRAAKVTALVASHMLPAGDQQLLLHPVNGTALARYGIRNRIMVCAGLLLLSVICFLGGWHSGHRWHSSGMASNNLPVYKSNRAQVQQPTIAMPAPLKTNRLTALYAADKIYGLDISRYQGDLLKTFHPSDSLHFIICKATQGTSLIDAEFQYNWKRLKELELVRGAYHFYMAKDDPLQQARHFLKTVNTPAGTDLPLIVDIEEGGLMGINKTADWQSGLLLFLAYIEQQGNIKPVIYTSLYFANQYLRQKTFANYPLWLAEYSGRRTPIVPETWKEKGITFWQKADTLTIGSQKIDFDMFIGDGAHFVEFINKGA